MKSSDVALIICVSVLSLVGSFMLGNSIVKKKNDEVVVLKYIEPTSGEVVMPNADYFNAYANNPTVEIFIGKCDGNSEFWDADLGRCVSKYEDKDKEENKEENKEDGGNGENNKGDDGGGQEQGQ